MRQFFLRFSACQDRSIFFLVKTFFFVTDAAPQLLKRRNYPIPGHFFPAISSVRYVPEGRLAHPDDLSFFYQEPVLGGLQK